MYQLFEKNEDGSKCLVSEFDTLQDAQEAAKLLSSPSIECNTETGSTIIL